MILLTPSSRYDDHPVVIALFGAGLLGSSVVNEVTTSGRFVDERLDLAWNDVALQAAHLHVLEARIHAALDGSGSGTHASDARSSSLKFFWSAGRAGFASTEGEAELELASFRALLGLVTRVAERFPSTRTSFYLLSSAGGLFQGQRFVDRSSKPSPRIPYGALKLRQEELLGAIDASIAKRVFRLTSVYGHLNPNHRSGLISSLISNGIRRRVTPITGWLSTLRDFIFVEDVARFIAPLLMDANEEAPDSSLLLAHGKPCSILEIQGMVERALGYRIYVRYSLDPSNREDITFSNGVLPSGWQSSDIDSNIERICKLAISSGAAFGFMPGVVARG